MCVFAGECTLYNIFPSKSKWWNYFLFSLHLFVQDEILGKNVL